jgi:hypothetical protein
MTRATRTEWAGRVRRWRTSGLPAREFSAREGLNPATLRWWSSQLQRNAGPPAAFVEVTMPVTPTAERIEVVVREGIRIQVSGAFDPDLLRRVVAALEAR